MIPSVQEITYRIVGALHLARFRAQGTGYFDDSPAAALRSFFAAILGAPAFAIALILDGHEPPTVDFAAVVLTVALSYCLAWTVFPVVAHRICLAIDKEAAFFRYLSAKNWTDVITTHLGLIASVLISSGIAPLALAPLLNLVVFAYFITLQGYIAWRCLSVSIAGAVGFVALDTVIVYFIASVAYGVIYQVGG